MSLTSRIGLDAKLYYLTTGTRASWGTAVNGINVGFAPANLSEISTAQDVTLTIEKGTAELKKRSSTWVANRGTLKSASLEFTLLYEGDSDTAGQALLQAFLNNTPIAVLVLDEAKEVGGAQGLWADWEVVNFSRGEPLEEGLTVNVTLKPSCQAAVDPEWIEVGPHS
jgi:hypothetical protein